MRKSGRFGDLADGALHSFDAVDATRSAAGGRRSCLGVLKRGKTGQFHGRHVRAFIEQDLRSAPVEPWIEKVFTTHRNTPQ
jgi:hypothetical protein